MDHTQNKHFTDLFLRSKRTGTFCFSDFLTPADAVSAYDEICLSQNLSLNYVSRKVTAFGGTDGCERVMLRFGDPEEFGYEVPFPIAVIRIVPLNDRFADELTHRDVLGALMNLGIERDVLGDIIVRKEGNAGAAARKPGEPGGRAGTGGLRVYVFAEEQIAGFLCENLTRIRHTSVSCEILQEAPADARPVLESVELNVASERLDCIIAKMYSLARGKAQLLFPAGSVSVGGRPQENDSYTPHPGDIISVRGYGKFIYRGTLHETKKGRLVVLADRYK